MQKHPESSAALAFGNISSGEMLMFPNREAPTEIGSFCIRSRVRPAGARAIARAAARAALGKREAAGWGRAYSTFPLRMIAAWP
jgi:hypothetical protein